jgi:hypothetical protein
LQSANIRPGVADQQAPAVEMLIFFHLTKQRGLATLLVGYN